jgi:MFS transporter, DHA1 family, inner membrane transport protein
MDGNPIESGSLPERDRISWTIVGPLCIVSFVGLMVGLAPSPFLPQMAESFGTSVALIGQIETAALLFGAGIGLIIGPLADHVGRKRIVLLGLVLTAIGAMGAVLAPNYSVLLVVWMFGAGFGGVLGGLNMSIASATFSGDVRRRAIGLIQAAFASAAVFGVPILTTVAAYFSGWRAAFIVAGVCALLSMVLSWLMLPDDSHGATERFSLSSVLKAYHPLLHSRPMIALFSAGAIRAVGWLGVLIFLGAFFMEYHEFSVQRVGLVYLIGGLAYVAGTLAVGGRLGRVNLRWLFSAATLGTGVLWLPVYGGWISANVALALLIINFFLGAVGFIAHTTLVAQETPAQPSTTLVLNGSIFSLGAAMGAALGGIILGLGGYALIGWTMPVLFIVAAALIWLSGVFRPRSISALEPRLEVSP